VISLPFLSLLYASLKMPIGCGTSLDAFKVQTVKTISKIIKSEGIYFTR